MEGWAKSFLLTASVLSCLSSVGPVLAAPGRQLYNDDPFNASHPFEEFGITASQKRADVPLRILSLGASIMSGVGSSTHNGCRKNLRDALRLDGYDVDMVGSLHSGTMKDYEHEAVPGDVLTQIRARVPNSIGFKPNIVIINGGTNDGNGNVDIANIGSRMNNILNDLWAADGMADTCIVLSTLIPTTNDNGAANRATINSQYAALVVQRAADGKCIYLGNMDPGGEPWLVIPDDYLAGESPHVHPNDQGHRMMAAVFYKAIHQALSDGKVVTPGKFTTGSVSGCDKVGGTGIDAGGYTQRGSGYDDGIYYHNSEALGILWTFDSDWDRSQWKFGRLFDEDHDDLLAWISVSDTEQTYAVWANSADGKGKFNKIDDMKPDMTCEAEGVYFIDMNGDGLDDLVCIAPNGNAFLSINQGDGDRGAGTPPTFKRVSDTAKIRSNDGQGRDRVVVADIDGDGRGDYGVIDDDGQVNFYRNGGTGDIPSWQATGARFQGHTVGTQFEDINGDGRDDALYVGTNGLVYTYTNARSCQKGKEGSGLKVAWRQGFYHGETTGPTHKGVASYMGKNETNVRNRIHFARIVGKSTVFGNYPKQDYVYLKHTKLSSGKHRFEMYVWQNTGAGGTKLVADGNKYCNMKGHSNGMVDYVWAYSFGTMELWTNRGKGTISDSDPDGYWDYEGTIWKPSSNMNRRDLHLQDWDGDGACDIIYADPKTGAVQVWINTYPKTGKWDWTHLADPAPDLTCPHKRGHGMNDLGVRFADLTGNHRADYLCLALDGKTTGFIHNDDDSFKDVGQIKVSDGYDRANYRYADVNGDGVDDLLWIEKFSGDTYVWYNQGASLDRSVTLGSYFEWREQKEFAYSGLAAGTCLFYADLDGNGRADEHYVLGTFNNKAKTSLSPSCGLSDKTGDDATMDGELPTVPTSGDDSGGGGGSSGGGSGNDTGATGDNDDYPQRWTSSDGDVNCNLQKFFAPATDVGNPDGGDEFCMGKWSRGIFPKLLEATANKNALCSVRVVFTDDTEMTVGKVCPDDGHQRMGTLQWTPFEQYFDTFELSDSGYKNGVGRLVAGLHAGDSIDAGKYYDDPPTKYIINRGGDGKGVLMGFYGTAGDRIDSLQPIFSSRQLLSAKITHATFDPSYETLNTLPFDQRGMTVISAPASFSNNASTEVEFSEIVTLSYQEVQKVTVSNEDDVELGGEFSGTVGWELDWQVFVPVAKKITQLIPKKIEIGGKFVGKHVTKKINTEETDIIRSESVSARITATLKKGEAVDCWANIVQSRVTVQYNATLEMKFRDNSGYYFDVDGLYTAGTASQVVSYCVDAADDLDVNDITDDDITDQGMFCKDGTYIGDWDVDLSEDEFSALCPADWADFGEIV